MTARARTGGTAASRTVAPHLLVSSLSLPAAVSAAGCKQAPVDPGRSRDMNDMMLAIRLKRFNLDKTTQGFD